MLEWNTLSTTVGIDGGQVVENVIRHEFGVDDATHDCPKHDVDESGSDK